MRWSRARACVDYGVHVKVSVCWYEIRMAGSLFAEDGWFVVHKVNLGCYSVRIYGSCKPGILASVLRVPAWQSTAMLLREIRWPEEAVQMNTVRAVPERWRVKWIAVEPDRDGTRSLDSHGRQLVVGRCIAAQEIIDGCVRRWEEEGGMGRGGLAGRS
jgi:hypothetical protein